MPGSFVVVGLSHHTAPLELRERLAVDTERELDALRAAMQQADLSEGLIVSTCNRVEVYGVSQDGHAAARRLRSHFSAVAGHAETDAHLYTHVDGDAVQHVFRVTSSLDSLVVGEPQILGQMKHAFECASEAGAVGSLLGRCFARAFAVAKRVRTETGIANGAVSISSIAVQLAESIFGDLAGRRVLLVGAGEMGEAAAKALAQDGSLLAVLNRSPERAEAVAEACGGQARPFDALTKELVLADVVITSTSSPHYVITPELMEGVIKARRHRPLFLIDIAVPRDVDPRVERMDNVFRYDVDDLRQVADQNIAVRRREAEAAETIVRAETEAFQRWLRTLDLTPTVVALRERVRGVIGQELQRTLPRLGTLDAKSLRSLDAMCDAMTNKLLHRPLTELKRSHAEDDGSDLIAAVQRLFDLEEDAQSGHSVGDAAALPHNVERQGERS